MIFIIDKSSDLYVPEIDSKLHSEKFDKYQHNKGKVSISIYVLEEIIKKLSGTHEHGFDYRKETKDEIIRYVLSEAEWTLERLRSVIL